jgi:tetratricopeptide (TPR) repeat protein
VSAVSLEGEITEATRNGRLLLDSSCLRWLCPWVALLSQIVFCSVACTAQVVDRAQDAGGCKGPAALEMETVRHPSAAASDALGAYFGVHKQSTCAIREFRKAVQLDPKFAEARYNLGLALLEFGNVKEAVGELKAAVGLNPSSSQTHTAMALALTRQGQADAAIGEFEQALRIDPRSVPALDGIAKLLIAEKRYTEKQSTISRTLRRMRSWHWIWPVRTPPQAIRTVRCRPSCRWSRRVPAQVPRI